MKKSQKQNVITTFSHGMHLLTLGLKETEMADFSPLSYIQLVRSLPFLTPKAGKRYPFRAELPRIGHHRV